MITITKEQLIASAHARIEFAEMMLAGELEPLKERTWSIELELARIALASLEAEAVAYTEKCEITNMQATGLYLRGFPDNSQGRDIALYTALPAPVSVPDELKEFLRLVECMLVDYRESNLGNAREWIRHISSASDAFEDAHSLSPWLWVRTGRRAAMLQAEAGNSPVIPDGWKLVPVELTGAMTNAMTDAILDDLHNVDVWRSVLAAAPQQEVIVKPKK